MINTIVIFSIVFLIHEIRTLIWPIKYDNQISKIKKDIKQGYLNPNDRPFIVFNFLYFIWSVIGLFTPYWIVFALFITFSFISGNFLKTENNTIKRIRLRRLDSFISSTILITLLITHYL
jgi:hypothetical protein